jgi:hypothetical protein
MDGLLKFNSQEWQVFRSDGLTLSLPRNGLDQAIYYHAHWQFIPAGEDAALVTDNTPRISLGLIGPAPKLNDWRDLETFSAGWLSSQAEVEEDTPRGPDLHLTQPDGRKEPHYAGWYTQIKVLARNGYELEFAFDAFRSSDRAGKLQTELNVKQFFGEPETPEWELPEWINEGEELTFTGRVRLQQINCSVPINSAKPVEWAQQLARRELSVTEFGAGDVLGGKDSTGQYDPQKSILNTGRLVILKFPAD